MGSVSSFKNICLVVLLLSACANEEDKKDDSIAVESKVVDVTIQSQFPDSYDYRAESTLVGHSAEGHETRMILAIPDILSLFREDVVLSSIAHIEIQLIASDVAVNPENIRLGFMSQNMTPYSTWNSRFALAPDQKWTNPGGDLMEFPTIAPDVEKVGEGLTHKRLVFNVTDTIIAAISAGETIQSFLLEVLPSEDNAENSSRIFTSNYSSNYAPKAVLTFNKGDIIVP